AREALTVNDGESLQVIATNFRSLPGILEYVNAQFGEPLSGDGQPGFTALDAFHAPNGDGLQVAALDVDLSNGPEDPKVEDLRIAESGAVAELCARFIGTRTVIDRDTGEPRP